MARQDFIDQLMALGYKVEERGGNRLAFPYIISIGPLANKEIWLGFIVADDFPLTPPSGPHVSPQILPLNTSSTEHPHGGVHPSDFGPEWEYWSRPFNGWATTDRTVRAYLAHIRGLFHKQ
jgi:hypothetical protein